jgi:RluA family pseudouridine synthase
VLKILRQYFKAQNNKNQIHIIHRLDRDASGLLVVARTADAQHHLKGQFFEHTITRRYDVIVHGIPKKEEGKLENLLLEDEETGVVSVTKDMKKGKLAILDYEVIKADKVRKISHVKCTLYTGRKHQIRVQFKVLGHPVLADRLYGTAEEPPGRLALHASHLAFEHPGTKRRVTFDSAIPGVFTHLFHG